MGKDLKGNELGNGISQRKDGSYMARFRVPEKKSPITLYDHDLTELKTRLEKAKKSYADGSILNFSQTTVNQWFETWMATYKYNLKTTSLVNYYNNYRKISKYIGNIKVTKLRQAHIQRAVKHLQAEGYAPSTIDNAVAIVYGMCRKAVENEMIIRNPCIGVETPKIIPEEKDVLSEEQERLFFEAVRGQRYYELFYILLYTGMRIGEALALEWEDVDFEKKTISVTKTIVRTKMYDRKHNKLTDMRFQITSAKSYDRVIPMGSHVASAFLAWRKKIESDKKRQGKSWGKKNYLLDGHPGLIFLTSKGGPVAPSDAWRYCQQGVDRVNQEEQALAEAEGREPHYLRLHLHLFRHSFATRCIEKGMNIKAVQKIMGHSSLQILEIYSHPSVDFLQDEYMHTMDKTEPNSQSPKVIDFAKLKKSV